MYNEEIHIANSLLQFLVFNFILYILTGTSAELSDVCSLEHMPRQKKNQLTRKHSHEFDQTQMCPLQLWINIISGTLGNFNQYTMKQRLKVAITTP